MLNKQLLKPTVTIITVLMLLLGCNNGFALLDASGKLFNPIDSSPITSIIVKFKKNSNLNSMSMQGFSKYLSKKVNLDLEHNRKLSTGAHVFKITNQNFSFFSANQIKNFNNLLINKLTELEKYPDIKYAEANINFYLQKTPNDERYNEQWHYFDNNGGINLPKAWDITTGSPNIIVSIVDSGIVMHEDLANKILPSRSFVNDQNKGDDPTDHGGKTSYHGTHVAGTIAAVTNTYGMVAGVAWQTKVTAARVLNSKGKGSLATIIEGMRWAAGISDISNENPAKILNMSLGSFSKCSKAIQETIDEISNLNTIIVVAAGNSNLPAKLFMPANCKNIITVGASTKSGEKAYYSNYGADTLDIVAPGGDIRNGDEGGILSLGGPGKLQFLQGTSMAAPHISGLIALMLSINPNLNRDSIVEYLQSSVKNDTMGVGLVDANEVLKLVKADQDGILDL